MRSLMGITPFKSGYRRANSGWRAAVLVAGCRNTHRASPGMEPEAGLTAATVGRLQHLGCGQTLSASGMPLIGSRYEPHVGQGCNKCLFSDAGGWIPRQRPKKPSYVVALSRPDLLPAPWRFLRQRPLKRCLFKTPHERPRARANLGRRYMRLFDVPRKRKLKADADFLRWGQTGLKAEAQV